LLGPASKTLQTVERWGLFVGPGRAGDRWRPRWRPQW
jgi:hypothetical protein